MLFFRRGHLKGCTYDARLPEVVWVGFFHSPGHQLIDDGLRNTSAPQSTKTNLDL
jgi:hypothetical protein